MCESTAETCAKAQVSAVGEAFETCTWRQRLVDETERSQLIRQNSVRVLVNMAESSADHGQNVSLRCLASIIGASFRLTIDEHAKI